jgi:hypothetical protein
VLFLCLKRGDKVTVEELDIIVDASIKKATAEFQKLVPAIKKEIKKVENEFNNTNIKDITAQIDSKDIETQAIKAKRKIKEIFDPNDISGLKITGLDEEINKVEHYYDKVKGLNTEASSGKGFKKYDSNAIANQIGLNNDANVSQNIEPTQQSLSLWDRLKQKILQIRPSIQQIKSSISSINASGMNNSFKSGKSHLNGISNMTVKIKNQIKQISSGMKQGLGQVLKYAGALFGLRSIYNVLRNSASSWLSSQNAGAQQLSANIEYMKYAMRKCICSSYRIYN